MRQTHESSLTAFSIEGTQLAKRLSHVVELVLIPGGTGKGRCIDCETVSWKDYENHLFAPHFLNSSFHLPLILI